MLTGLVKLLTDKGIKVDEVIHSRGHEIGYAEVDHIMNFFALTFHR